MGYSICNSDCREKLNEQRDKIRKLGMYKMKLREIRKKQILDMKQKMRQANTAKHYTTYIYGGVEHSKPNSELRMWTSHYEPKKTKKTYQSHRQGIKKYK